MVTLYFIFVGIKMEFRIKILYLCDVLLDH
nr:MAG TPA: hypothetical protein [Caudoviricetes sp.]